MHLVPSSSSNCLEDFIIEKTKFSDEIWNVPTPLSSILLPFFTKTNSKISAKQATLATYGFTVKAIVRPASPSEVFSFFLLFQLTWLIGEGQNIKPSTALSSKNFKHQFCITVIATNYSSGFECSRDQGEFISTESRNTGKRYSTTLLAILFRFDISKCFYFDSKHTVIRVNDWNKFVQNDCIIPSSFNVVTNTQKVKQQVIKEIIPCPGKTDDVYILLERMPLNFRKLEFIVSVSLEIKTRMDPRLVEKKHVSKTLLEENFVLPPENLVSLPDYLTLKFQSENVHQWFESLGENDSVKLVHIPQPEIFSRVAMDMLNGRNNFEPVELRSCVPSSSELKIISGISSGKKTKTEGQQLPVFHLTKKLFSNLHVAYLNHLLSQKE